MIVKFEENECFRFDVPKISNSLVYFLLYNEEVVYVGQTVQGLVRPLSHKDKVFDSVAVISVPEDLLTAVEDYYISKYIPKYNKTMRMYLPMLVARNRIREIIGNDSYTVRDVKRTHLTTESVLPFSEMGMFISLKKNSKSYVCFCTVTMEVNNHGYSQEP